MFLFVVYYSYMKIKPNVCKCLTSCNLFSNLLIDSNTQLALNGILDRSKQILGKYIEEERLSGSLPASRYCLLWTPLGQIKVS